METENMKFKYDVGNRIFIFEDDKINEYIVLGVLVSVELPIEIKKKQRILKAKYKVISIDNVKITGGIYSFSDTYTLQFEKSFFESIAFKSKEECKKNQIKKIQNL